MAYCEAGDVMDMLKEDAMNPIIGDRYIEDPQKRREMLEPLAREAIGDADAEIDGYLMKRYPVPMSPVPAVIRKYSKDIAVYNLVSRTGINESERQNNYLTRYKNAISFLSKVAKGEADIVKEGTDLSMAAATGFQLSSSPRLFSRKSMRGL